MELQAATERYLPQVDGELAELVAAERAALQTYYGMMRYHLGWVDDRLQPGADAGGKRIRPILCLLACEAAGGDPTQALPAASALELVHNFSLVHDDIEDRSNLRRGRQTVWVLWGTAHGINVGDGLFVLARLMLHRLAGRGLGSDRQLNAMRALDRACLDLCEGQFLDMSFEERVDVQLDEYLWMIRQKTASLLAASAEIGAIIATDSQSTISGCSRFGENLGMAFQIRDDILGIWGDELTTGKSAATDIRYKKKTLPLVYALSTCGEGSTREGLDTLLAKPAPLDTKDVQSILEILDHLEARQHAEEMAEAYYLRALKSLDQSGIPRRSQGALRELADVLSDRIA